MLNRVSACCVCMTRLIQLYPIDEILQRYNKGTICGPALIEKLSAGMLMTRPERIFFVKVLGKYLMKVAFT